MRTKRLSAIWQVIAIVSLVLSLPQYSSACSCVGARGKKILDDAAATFSGKVTKVAYLDANQARVEPRIVVTFEVYRWWKGAPTKTVVLHTFYNKWSCEGYGFKVGKEYLVFAYLNPRAIAEKFASANDSLGVNICGATGLLADAKVQLRDLGPGSVPK